MNEKKQCTKKIRKKKFCAKFIREKKKKYCKKKN